MSADNSHRMELPGHGRVTHRPRECVILLTAIADWRQTAGSARSAARDEHSMSVHSHRAFQQVAQGGQRLEMFHDARGSRGRDDVSRPASTRRFYGSLRHL